MLLTLSSVTLMTLNFDTYENELNATDSCAAQTRLRKSSVLYHPRREKSRQ